MWTVKCDAWSAKSAVWSVDCEVRSVKCEVWSAKSAVWSVKSVEREVRRVQCEECSVKCVVWSVKTVKCEVELQMWHVKQDTSFAECMHARAWLAHGACKFYRWERSFIYIFKAASAPPRAGTTGILIIKGSWEAILPSYEWLLLDGIDYDEGWCASETWPWWRVVWDFTLHNNTSEKNWLWWRVVWDFYTT